MRLGTTFHKMHSDGAYLTKNYFDINQMNDFEDDLFIYADLYLYVRGIVNKKVIIKVDNDNILLSIDGSEVDVEIGDISKYSNIRRKKNGN